MLSRGVEESTRQVGVVALELDLIGLHGTEDHHGTIESVFYDTQYTTPDSKITTISIF